jgi:hypothetical protein
MNRINLTLITFTILFFSNTCYGQLEKGNFLIGGTMSIQSAKYKSTGYAPYELKSRGFDVTPDVAYFITKNLAAGLAVSYGYSVSRQDSKRKSVSNGISAGPTLRYYFNFKNWAIFPQFNYSLGRQSYDGLSFDPLTSELVAKKIHADLRNLSAGAGATYFISRNIGIEAIVSYQNSKTTFNYMEYGNHTTDAIKLNIGLQIYLNKKSE